MHSPPPGSRGSASREDGRWLRRHAVRRRGDPARRRRPCGATSRSPRPGCSAAACLAGRRPGAARGSARPSSSRHAVEVDGRLLLIDGVAAWGRHAERIVAVTGGADDTVVWSLRPDQVTIDRRAATSPARPATASSSTSPSPTSIRRSPRRGVTRRRPRRCAARLSRVILAAGALATVAQMTIDYTNERRQFGKPVATFQAVQHHLVTAAQSAVQAQMAADIAVRALVRGCGRIRDRRGPGGRRRRHRPRHPRRPPGARRDRA